jgi:hypothetical protein
MLLTTFLVALFTLFCLEKGYADNVTKLAWKANADPDIAGYRVYYRLASTGYNTYDYVDVGNATKAVIKNLIDGETYYFSLTAYDLVYNESDLSHEVERTIFNQAMEELLLVDQSESSILKLDFDNTPNPTTLEGWTSYTLKAYTPAIGYGWRSTYLIGTRDRQIGDSLNRDLHLLSKNGESVFLVDLLKGRYRVTLYMSDPIYSYHAVDIYAEDELVLPSVQVLVGQSLAESFEIEASDGQLTIHFVLNGYYAIINGLEITEIYEADKGK